MSSFRPVAVAFAATATLALGCGASTVPRSAAPAGARPTTTTTTAAPSRSASAAEDPAASAWASVPYPARSIARLRALLRNAPEPLRMLDAALVRVQGFDLEQPAYATSNAEAHVFSLGLGRELADSLRKANDNEKCTLVEVRGNLRFACAVDGKPLAELAVAEPAGSTPSDLHVEANAAIMRELAKSKVHDQSLDALASLDGMSLDLTLAGTPELRVGWHVTGEDPASIGWLNAPVAPPPAGFFQLPTDSELAVFGHAPSAVDQAPMKKVLLDAIGGKDSDCAANSAAERADIEKLFFTGGSFVGAIGLERAKAEAAADALDKAPADKRKLAAMRDAVRGWAIFGVEEPAARWADGLHALQKRECPKKGRPKQQVTVNKRLAPRLGLPPGTVEITNVRPADKDGTPSSRDIVLIAPDRSASTERTWIAFAHDEATAVARLKGVLAGPSALGSRPGLASLRGPASAGAFVTASGAAWLASDEKTDVQIVTEARMLLRARELPTGGRTPIVLRMASTHDAKGKGGETSVRVSLDAAVLGDVAAFLF